MRILLIAVPILDWHDEKLVPIAMDAKRTIAPLSIYLLSSILKQHQHAVDIIDLIALGSDDVIREKNYDQYDLIGLGATSFSWPSALRCIKNIRKNNKEVPIVLGGIHPTMFYEYILSTSQADFVIRGEGENAMVELCEHLQGKRNIKDITSLAYRDDKGKIVANSISKQVILSDLPLPDYDMLPKDVYGGLSVESSRGCPFDCIFCSTNYRKTYRELPAEEFVERVLKLNKYVPHTKQKTINIIDDEFSLHTKRAIEIADRINQLNLNTKFVFDSRINDINNEEFVKTISPLVGRLLVGAESGYDKGLQNIGKKTTVEKIENAARILNNYGISHLCDFSFIIGFPWESYDDIVKTISFAAKLMTKYSVNVLLQWYIQIPGSRLWDMQRQKGILHEGLYDEFGIMRDTYIFRSGVNLTLEEFRKITEIVVSIRLLYSMSNVSKSNKIEYGHPWPIRRYFPSSNENGNPSGLNSLREVSNSILSTQKINT